MEKQKLGLFQVADHQLNYYIYELDGLQIDDMIAT
jgi:hypothetical protein